MPALITHNYFAKDVYDKLDKKIQNKFKDAFEFYEVFCHSFDNFFYYRLLFPGGKNIRKLGHYAQHSNTQSYFINMIRIIQDAGLNKEPQVLAYLYGSITHYVLDSICHPFVFYKTGNYSSKKKETYKYNGLHADMEYSIDSYLYEQRTNNKIYKFKLTKEIMPKLIPNSDLKYVINKTFKKTFNKENIAKYYFKGYNWSRFLYRLVMVDRTGIKKALYMFGNFILPNNIQSIKSYSFHKKKINTSYLNLENKEWNHPSDLKLKYNYSFLDLYSLALNKCVSIINEVNKVLYNKENIKILLDIIPNIDYGTGFLLNKNKPMKYFEF